MKIFFIFFIFSHFGWTASERDLQKQVALKQNKLLNIEARQEALLKDLIRINKKMKSQANKLGNIQREIEITNAEVAKQKIDIKALSQQLVASKKRLTTKIKAISKIKSGNLLQVALVHSNLADIERSVKMMGIVASYDVQYINDYYEKKLVLGQDLKKLDARYQVLKKNEADMAEQKEALEKNSRERVAWLEEVKRNRLFTEAEILKIKKNGSHNFDDLGVFDVFSKDTIVKNKGLLSAPVDGQLSSAYGFSPNNDSVIVGNSGVFVSTASSRSVKALFNAEVVFSGIVDGLGRLIILDHGDNYYSVYGNLSSVNVKNRQIVRTGNVIAQSDYSPLFGSNGVYFEMRHYSQSLNPQDWIRSFHESN
ncbi:MAG: peptidoglycan DD-metalloendopeptidase family protein [Bdellovibrionaceae bacterium]|nr:peptidoglycan DD-metalloendopeptidase family protein [Pseudobdellovibrionaceae bacterium]